jgi:hypothetical protein
MIRCRVALLVSMVLVPAAAPAQMGTTGVVTGRVVDSSGAVLPGATISLKSPEALGEFSGITDAQGVFRIVNVPPATYEVRAELQGFQAVVRQATVRLGGVSEVDFALSVGSVTETVTVSAEAATVDPERAGLSININNKALTSVPITVNRRFQDVWLMVPDPGGAGQSTEQRLSIDGMDMTDPDTARGSMGTVNLNYDAIQDVEVKALGAEASDGTSMVGQFLNVVTKSGGNQVHGSAALAYIPQRFNGSNVLGVAPNQRTNIQPDVTLGGPIKRDKAWYFGSYRRLHENVTQNNAPVPAENRGNLWFVKGTTQLRANHRLQVTFQYDRTVVVNGLVRSTVNPGTNQTFSSASAGLSGATARQVNPSAFGSLVDGGPMVGFNYNWVVGPRVVVQMVGNYFQKVNDSQPNDGGALGPTKVIQTNAAGNIAGSLTTIGQEGSFGGIATNRRSMLFLSPSVTFVVNNLGSHEFRGGADIYPRSRRRATVDLQPVEFYYRPPGTTGSADLLFERQTLRNYDGSGATTDNTATVHYYAGYFQDRWKPTSRVSIKAGVRFEYVNLITKDRESFLGPLLPANFPTNTEDLELEQSVIFPNFGIAYDLGKWGVFRGTASRQHEWIDLGGGVTHFPYVLATDIVRANPRTTAPVLNQSLPGGFAVGTAAGRSKDGSESAGRATNNEFSAGWEHRLPASSSISAVFLWRRTWDVKSAVDQNIIRDERTGAFLGRPFPDYNAVQLTVQRQFQWFQNRSLQLLYTKNFAGSWGINSTYWYLITTSARTTWNPTTDTLQYLGFSPADVLSERATGRHRARVSSFVSLPLGVTGSIYYSYSQGNRSNVMTGDFPLNAPAPTFTLSNGRVVADPFFNPSYPRARRNDVDMIKADDTHIVNLRVEKTVTFPGNRKFSLAADAYNLFNAAAAGSFLSSDIRSANFGLPSGYQPARVGQLTLRVTF